MLKVSPFGIRSFVRGESTKSQGLLTLKSSAGISYIEPTVVTKNADLVDKYKVMCGYLNPDRAGVNNAADGKYNVTTKLFLLRPGEVVTESYIIIGTFDKKTEAENYISYIKTKFARFLVFLTLSSMHITQVNFQFVPDLDFSKSWKDEELYKIFNLDTAEQQYIDSVIREME